MQNKYGKWIALIALLVLILVVVSLVKKSSNNNTAYNNDQTSTSTTDTTTTTPPATTTPSVPAGSAAYDQALVTYKDHRIQFDATCNATPTNITAKSGSKIMLDNRGAAATTVVIDGVTYSLAGYGYKIVTLPTVTTTNKTLLLNCGQKVHVATILLQK